MSIPLATTVIKRDDGTLNLMLELPNNMMNLTVDDKASNTSEANIITKLIHNIDYAKSAICELKRSQWTVLQRSLDQLQKLSGTLKLLQSLLAYRGLWSIITVKKLKFLIEMAADHETLVNSYLQTMLDRWSTIAAAIDTTMHSDMIDASSIRTIAGMWPRANNQDRLALDQHFQAKDFFPSVTDDLHRAKLRAAL